MLGQPLQLPQEVLNAIERVLGLLLFLFGVLAAIGAGMTVWPFLQLLAETPAGQWLRKHCRQFGSFVFPRSNPIIQELTPLIFLFV